MKLTVLDSATGGAMPGAAVYLWHCDRDGNYSMYSQGAADQNYLRGVQEAGERRVGHVHDDLPGRVLGPVAAHALRGVPEPGRSDEGGHTGRDLAARAARGLVQPRLRDRRLRAERHEPARTSLATDMVFSDGVSQQTPTVTGNVTDGMTITLNVPV